MLENDTVTIPEHTRVIPMPEIDVTASPIMDIQITDDPQQRAELKSILAGGIRLMALPPLLEKRFRQTHHQFATNVVKATLPVAVTAVFFVVMLTLMNFSTLPAIVWGLGIVVLLSFALVYLSAYVVSFNRWLPHSLGFGGMLCIMAMHIAAGVIQSPVLSSAALFGVAYITIAVFSMTNLPVGKASAWVFASLILVVVLANCDRLAVNFNLFIYYAVSPAIIGIALGVVQELRERRLFVQEYLLAVENRELEAMTRKLDALSRRDPLTGLYNRRYFNELLQEEWNRCLRNSEPLSLLYMDVDHFKHYNDFYGHQQGDLCLSAVASALSDAVLRSGDVVARYGGEEFVALFPHTDLNGARQMAEKILMEIDGLSIPHASSVTAPTVTLSLGVASLVPDRLYTPELLLQKADEALYRAKAAGRHRVSV